MALTPWIQVFLSVVELVLIIVVMIIFLRLRRSEAVLKQMQLKQKEFLNKLHFNAELEQELISSFEKRQQELAYLDQQLDKKKKEIQAFLKKTEDISRSPQLLRKTVIEGRQRGRSLHELAEMSGLSQDEIELILMESGKK